MSSIFKQRGQSSVEYVVICAALALALGVGMVDDSSVLKQLLDAFNTAYQKISYFLSLPM
jgi:Flp pilus assembly pilin Flp